MYKIKNVTANSLCLIKKFHKLLLSHIPELAECYALTDMEEIGIVEKVEELVNRRILNRDYLNCLLRDPSYLINSDALELDFKGEREHPEIKRMRLDTNLYRGFALGMYYCTECHCG